MSVSNKGGPNGGPKSGGPKPGAKPPAGASPGPKSGRGTSKESSHADPLPLPPAPETRPRKNTGEDPLASLLRTAAEAKGGAALEALERVAETLVARGETEQAIWHLEEAVRRAGAGPADPRLVARLMVSLASLHEEHLGRLDRAVELLEQAHKLDPDSPRAIDAGRRIYRAVGDRSRVARLYEVELETAPPGPRVRRGELLVELAEVLARLGELPAAAARLETAVPLFSDAARIEELKERLASTYAAPGCADAPDAAPDSLTRAAALFRDLATARRARGDREGEITCYRRALGAVPNDLEAASGLEAAYRAAGRDDELARLYRQAPWLPGAARRVAELAIAALSPQLLGTAAAVANQSSGRNAAAVEAVLAAAAEGPIDDLLTRLDAHLTTAGEPARLAGLYERLLQVADNKDPLDRADRLVVVAKHYKVAGDLVRFEAALLDALASYPGHEEAYALLSEHLSVRRDHATLVAVAEAALAAAPPDEHAHRLEELAELYDKRLGDVTGAVDAWTRRRTLGPSEKADGELRRLRVKEDRWAGLVASLERELELAASPELRAEVLRRLGQVHRERHELEKARDLFSQALELRPSDPSLYRTLGEIAELEGRFDELAQLLRRQYRSAKERVEKLNLLRRLAALYEERLGDWDGVEWACDEILTHLPSDRDALRRLEQCHEMKGQDGLEGLLRVLEAHANAAATPAEKIALYRRLAITYGASGQHELAADRWERLLRLDKTDAAATWALARTQETLGKHADAALAYGRLLDETRGRSIASDGLNETERADAWRHYARILDKQIADAVRATSAWNHLLALRPADREALSALTVLHRTRGELVHLGDLLARRLAISGDLSGADAEETASLALELARLLAQRNRRADARARVADLLASMSAESRRGATGRDALVLAVELADAEGDARGALTAIERLYFTADLEDRPELARAVAERWSALSPNGPATLLAWERLRALAPEDPAALDELSTRYAAAGLHESQREIDLARLDLAEAAGDRTRTVDLGESLRELIEQRLGDPTAAFFQLERVLGTPGEALHGRVLDGLRGLADRSGQFAELVRVLGQEPGIDPLIERARLLEERLGEPKRAFEVVRGALSAEQLSSFGPPSTVGALLRPHLLRLGERIGDPGAVLDALCDLLPHLPRAEQAELFSVRADVLERSAKDNAGALDELLRAVPFVDEGTDAAEDLDAEIRRLARTTRRHEDLLALLYQRAARAARASDRRHALLDEAVAVLEDDLAAPRRAFRVRLATLAQLEKPLEPPPELRDDLWRLARLLESDDRAAPASGLAARSRLQPLPVSTAPNAAVQPATAPPGDPLEGAPVVASRPARDDTLEVDLRDLVIESRAQRRDQTMELSLGDLAEVARGAPPPRPSAAAPPRPAPPPLPGMRGHTAARRAPMQVAPPADFDGEWLLAAPELDRPVVELEGTAWEELAEVMRRADLFNRHPSATARLAVAKMWEDGAGQVERAFDELRDAFADPNSPVEVRAALDALCARHGAEDVLVDILDAAVADTASSERAIALLLDSATIREGQGQLDDAEARYRRILGIRPDQAHALERLESYYRSTERWEALAELIERRLNGLLERMPAGPARSERAIELAEIYEKLGKRYEAIGTLESLLQREPTHAGALVSLGRLYEAQSQWGKVIESLTRRIDLLEVGDGSATQPEARRLRMRIAKLYEEQLELPERALEAYLALDRGGLPDPVVDEAIEGLLEHLGRWETLADRYLIHDGRPDLPLEDRVELGRRRIEILRHRAPNATKLAEALRALATLAPADDGVLADLEDALVAIPGSLDERIEVSARRLQLAESIDADPMVRAELLSRLGVLEAEAGRRAEAIHTLEQAVSLAPDRPETLAQLARIREGGEDWHGYAEARERQAAVVTDDRSATRALVDAASAELKPGGDRERARADAERALMRCPEDATLLADLRAVFVQLADDEQVMALLRREIALTAPATNRRAELLAQLGARALKRGALDEAGAAFHSANEADPGYAAAVHGLADLAARTGEWDETEPLLRYAATRKGVSASDSAAFFRRIAQAASARGNADEAYASLIEADRRQPGDLRTRVQLGQNRFSQNRFREAAQHLSVVAEHADLPRLGIDAAQALYEGAVAELKIRRPERAEAQLRAALRVDERHEPALGLLAEQAQARGDLAAAVSLLERQAEVTQHATDRAARWERIAELATTQLDDATRARAAMRRAVEAWDAQGNDTRPPASLLDALLQLERKTGAVPEAAATAARLLQCGSTPAERARRLRESAALEAALGNDALARERLAAAHDLLPTDTDTLAGYSALLTKEHDDEAVAQLLTRALVALPPPLPAERAPRAALWLRLAEARERQGDDKGALVALERVLELDPSRTPLRMNLLERYGDDPAHEPQVTMHRQQMLEHDPLDVASLKALEKLEARSGRTLRMQVLQGLQAVAGALAVGRPIPIAKSGARAPLLNELTDAQAQLLEHADAKTLAEVFGAIYEGLPPDQVEDLAALGVRPDARISPVGGDAAGEVFAECARLLGNRRTALYSKDDPSMTRPLVMVRAPTAVIVSPALAALPAAELRFHLARALWLTRPEHALAVGLPRESLNSLFMSAVRAFHPRHAAARQAGVAGAPGDADAQALRKQLPYKVVRRLVDLFQREVDTPFSSARWRRGVEHSINRAGLIACGDFRAAARVLRDEGDDEALRELARFALSPAYEALLAGTP